MDNRDSRAGEKFADADLIAAPIRLIVSPKNIANNVIEVKYRVNDFDTSTLPNEYGVESCVDDTIKTIQTLLHK